MPIQCIQVKDFDETIHTQLSKPSKYGCESCEDSCPKCSSKKKSECSCCCWDREFQVEESTQIIGIPKKLKISVSCCLKCNGKCCGEGEKCLNENVASLPSGAIRTGKRICCSQDQECGEDCCPDGQQCGADGKCCIADCCDCCYCVGPVISMAERPIAKVSCVDAAKDPEAACAKAGIDLYGSPPEIFPGVCCDGGGPNDEKCVPYLIDCEPPAS